MTTSPNNKAKIKKVLKGVAVVIAILSLLLAISFGCRLHQKNCEIAQLTETVDSLENIENTLRAQTAISISSTVKIETKNIFSINKVEAQAIAHSISEITRGQIMDSLYERKGFSEKGNHVVED